MISPKTLFVSISYRVEKTQLENNIVIIKNVFLESILNRSSIVFIFMIILYIIKCNVV